MESFWRLRSMAYLIVLLPVISSCSKPDLMPVTVELGTRSISKLPFIIAADQGLYEKYGLDVELKIPRSDFEGGINIRPGVIARIWHRLDPAPDPDEWDPDFHVDGLTPMIVKKIDRARYVHRVAIAGTDCLVRAQIIGSKGMKSVEELKGKRLGISARRDTTLGFAGLAFARHMGWDPIQDISLKLYGRDLDALKDGLVDAYVANEIRAALAIKEGFPVLEDTQKWNVAVAGNSVMVKKGWLEHEDNREKARRFLKATVEGLALFHQDRELALKVMAKWNGITDSEIAIHTYERGQWMERKPYPCYAGIDNTFEMYDSNEMRKYKPADFYDDSLMRELDESGFIDALY